MANNDVVATIVINILTANNTTKPCLIIGLSSPAPKLKQTMVLIKSTTLSQK